MGLYDFRTPEGLAQFLGPAPSQGGMQLSAASQALAPLMGPQRAPVGIGQVLAALGGGLAQGQQQYQQASRDHAMREYQLGQLPMQQRMRELGLENAERQSRLGAMTERGYQDLQDLNAGPFKTKALPAPGGQTARPTVETQPLPDTPAVKGNNYGNIRTADANAWQGKTTPQGAPFETFDSPENGLRAIGKTLLSYGNQGINTLADIVTRWAPPGENDTQKLIMNASLRTGFSPNERVDLTNPDVLGKVINAIAVQEHGKPIGADLLSRSVSAALGATTPATTPTTTPAAPAVGDTEPMFDRASLLRQYAVARRTPGMEAMAAQLLQQINSGVPDGKYLDRTGTLRNTPGLIESEVEKQQALDAAKAGIDIASARAKSYESTRGSEEAKQPGQSIEYAKQLRGEYTQRSTEFMAVRDAYNRIQAAFDDEGPAADISFIYSFMKMMDPGTGIKEGEYATAQNAGGVPAWLYGMYNKVLGQGFLEPEVKKQFMDQASSQFAVSEKAHAHLTDTYRGLARELEVNENLVVPDLSGGVKTRERMTKPKAEPPTKPEQVEDIGEVLAVPATPDKLRVGAVYRGPNGLGRWTGTEFEIIGGR